ncbi:MAG: hypothetical protein GY943_02430 [Chloroflexi bacterium]|nr:hypothetical protein [Chloroflexota bacterium]
MDEIRFIGEPITVEFDKFPTYSKKPPCPDRIIWRDETFLITECLQEWRDYQRRGRMSSNMRPANLKKAASRGSWGVGRYFFQVKVADGRLFELYYDRAPKGQNQRSGSWHLLRQIITNPKPRPPMPWDE